MKHLFTLAAITVCCTALAQTTCSNAPAALPDTVYEAGYTDGSELPTPYCLSNGNNAPTLGTWYTYTPTQLYTTTLSTTVTGYENKDTRVHIYSGTCGSLTCVAGDDDSGPNYSSIVSFTAQANTTYYIAFDNYWNSDNFHFLITEEEYSPPMFTQQAITVSGTVYGVVDMNGDYLDDIVAPGTSSVGMLYQATNDSGFTSATLTTTGVSNTANWSMAAGDFDKNGYNDLLYGGGSGADIVLANNDGTGFGTIHHSPQYIFSQRTNFADINNDGNLDAFVCHDIQPNVYFLNDGVGGFTFHQGGLGDVSTGGNYGSIWIDYDNDGDSDLFIAKCRGGSQNPAAVDELHRNNGDGTFTNVALEAGFVDYQQSWSSAWADFDNDGDMDVLIGASSDTDGSHKLMRNNGDGTFTNVTEGSGYDTNLMLNIEHVAFDFNNDGWVDVIGGGNKLMLNNGDMTFSPKPVTFGNGPIGDLNNDGFLDVVTGSNVYFNYDNGNHWIKINMQGVASNSNGIGARVEVHTTGPGIEKQIRDVRSGDGFRYMNTLNPHFGLGTTDAIEQVVIKWPSGTIDIFENPEVDTALLAVEGSTLGLNQNSKELFTLYPNPAKDVLNIKNTGSFTPTEASIFTVEGRLVSTEKIKDGKVNVQHLAKGTYVIQLKAASGKQLGSRFIKG
ncbi:FG-GAP-like repeat-containing protein [Flavobacterium sp. RHBU_3]|uniref:FG-GAP-like repeat-containing protein n=1 Tax=Flavobacterium sp. RHBU_3 TaxID=3391184 RepID=UPI0039851392